MIDAKNLSGLDKATILFKALGPDLSVQLFKGLSRSQMQKIRENMAKIANIPFDVKKAVLEEFYFSFVSEKFIPAEEETKKPFEFMLKLTDEQIAYLIASEPPIIMALAIAQLPVERQVNVLQKLDPTVQPKVLTEMGHLTEIPLEGVVSIANNLKDKSAFIPRASEFKRGGGQDVAGILSKIPPRDEKRFLEFLSKEAPELVDQIKRYYFSFEDLPKLPPNILAEVLKSVEISEIAYALKGQPDEIRDLFKSLLPQRSQIILEDEMKLLEGPQPRRKVEAAQKKIVEKLRELEKEGRFNLEDFMDTDFIE
ncbi:MAG TPA: FliG C-terminal domain-containing protein [Candidatus Marinimicrobia bacterium]|jgi:flagellar motor switch protein FliG|nr:FliG C-terminal domain-containing protein [Candidatus Neomarinimicrobiota bacterium]HOV22915.1 FliG C-terminal domain-containing protein [Candidatus Neomarinimicrobiota bacterium]HPA99603.1 FliG C-terminal domain-containing protein [Candidatus Neomarinimicrobiota bacterium]HQE95482.1 FliG C-terminal domain-containing protein [Candidatus Neomarinimicrobiota bacterium]HQH55601.1 FliG C-terminal domain-containing protein [Candidatus Neomarinimicrobiota bacterium]